MGRKKKIVEETKMETSVNEFTDSTPPGLDLSSTGVNNIKTPIALLGLDLGREDLNSLVAKLNEVITRINE